MQSSKSPPGTGSTQGSSAHHSGRCRGRCRCSRCTCREGHEQLVSIASPCWSASPVYGNSPNPIVGLLHPFQTLLITGQKRVPHWLAAASACRTQSLYVVSLVAKPGPHADRVGGLRCVGNAKQLAARLTWTCHHTAPACVGCRMHSIRRTWQSSKLQGTEQLGVLQVRHDSLCSHVQFACRHCQQGMMGVGDSQPGLFTHVSVRGNSHRRG